MNENDEQEQEIDLLKLFGVILEKIHYIIIALIAGTIVGFLYSKLMITPLYKSDVMLYINNSLSISSISISASDLDASSTLVDAYEVILNSRDTLKQVASKSGLDYTYEDLQEMVSSEQQSDTSALKIEVSAESPEDAYRIATVITQVLPDRINEIIDGSSALVVDYAILPTESYYPSNIKNALIVGAVCAVIMVAYIVIVDFFMRDEIRDREELESYFDVPVLAVIPDHEQKISEEEQEFAYYSSALNTSKKKAKTTSTRKKGKSNGTTK